MIAAVTAQPRRRARPTSSCSPRATATVHQEPDQGLHRAARERLHQRRLRGRAHDRLRSPRRHRRLLRAQGQAAQPLPGLRARPARSCSAFPIDAGPGPGALPAARRPARALRRPQGRRRRHLPARPRERRGARTSPRTPSATPTPRSRRTASSSSTPGASAATTRSTSFPLDEPGAQDAAHLRRPTTTSRPSSRHGRQHASTTPPTEDDDIYNLRSLDLQHRRRSSSTPTCWAATWRRRALERQGADRLAFISYFKGEYRLHTKDLTEPMKEVEQEVQAAAEGLVDFQPDVSHQVVPENKRGRSAVREAAPGGPAAPRTWASPRAATSSAARQVALTDVLGDQNFLFTVLSVREFRSYDGHLHQPRRAASTTGSAASTTRSFFYASPYGLAAELLAARARFATQRYTGGLAHRRSTRSTSSAASSSRPASCDMQRAVTRTPTAQAQVARAGGGRRACRSSSTTAPSCPFTAALTEETTRFRSSGRSPGSTFSSASRSRRRSGACSRRYTVRGGPAQVPPPRLDDIAARPARPRASTRAATTPTSSTSAATWSCAATPTCPSSGNQGFFANVELRFPLIDLMADPASGILGPVRGTLFFGIGGAHFQGEPYKFAHQRPRASPT